MTERYLVTGGQGFIGSWIVKRLLETGSHVMVLDRARDDAILSQVLEREALAALSRIDADIADTRQVLQACAEHEVTRIVHLAGLQVPACRRDPVLGARVNVLGTLNVFEAARELRDQVRSVVYASSAAVAGRVEDYDGPIADGAPHVPRTHYGVFKAANEGNARVYFLEHGIASVGLRPYTVYGVGREVGITSGPTKAIKAAVLGRRYTIPFRGPSSFIYVEDLAEIFLGAARANPGAALALNVRGRIDTVENFIAALRRAFGPAGDLIDAGGEPIPIAYEVDEAGLARLLGGTVPDTPLADGIARTARRFRELAEAARLHDHDLE
jgi:nucleoside-diphosphate-sugar epimerase